MTMKWGDAFYEIYTWMWMSEKIENVVKDCVLHKDVLSQPLAITLFNDATDSERLFFAIGLNQWTNFCTWSQS